MNFGSKTKVQLRKSNSSDGDGSVGVSSVVSSLSSFLSLLLVNFLFRSTGTLSDFLMSVADVLEAAGILAGNLVSPSAASLIIVSTGIIVEEKEGFVVVTVA